jgi:hypothetical protein
LEKTQSEIDLRKAQAIKAENYQAPGSQDPETIKLINRMSELETQGLEDTPTYKALAGRVQFLQTQKGGLLGAGVVKRMSTNIGEVIFDPATKKYTYADGSDIPAEKLRTMAPLGNDPLNAAALAEAKASGKNIGSAASKATIDLIDAVPMAEIQTRQLDQLLNHEGLSRAVGLGIPKALQLPGTPEADFAARFEQIQGGVFLQAFNSLRGGGQITESEGTKATAALLRAKTTQSEKEFKEAIREYIGYIKTGLERLNKKAGLRVSESSPSPTATPQPTAEPQPSFSGVRTKEDVRSMYQAGKLSKQQANAILSDMKARGVF